MVVNEGKKPETYQATFNATGLAGGVYFYRLQTGDFAQTLRMVLVRTPVGFRFE